MATRKEKCQRCKTKFLVVVDAQGTFCPVCGNAPATKSKKPARVASIAASRMPVTPVYQGFPNGNQMQEGTGLVQRPSAPPNMGTGFQQRPSPPPTMGTGFQQRPAPPPPMGMGWQQTLPPPQNTGMGWQQTLPAPQNTGMGWQQRPAPPPGMGMGWQQRPSPPPNMGMGMQQTPYARPTMGTGFQQRPSPPPTMGMELQQRPAAPPNTGTGLQQRPSPPPAMGLESQQRPSAPPNTGTGLQQKPASPAATGKKRAVLCGITYKGNPKSLPGSLNDVMCMKNFLINKLGFTKSSVRLLTEDEIDPTRTPTKKNIRKALRWLVKECQPGDSLVFHYSGHGSKIKDTNGDEYDGHDESMCPVDYETEGRILDDEINEIIVRPLPRGVTLHAIIDTCFSGTFLDLPYLCRLNATGNVMWEDHRVRHTYKGSTGGTAISISACDDHQTSGDTTAFTGKANGALTYSFIKTLENKPKMTYGELLFTMRKEIQAAQLAVAGPNASVQEPQLSATSRLDIHTKNIKI